MEDVSVNAFSWRLAVKHIMCVRLKQWPIDRIERKQSPHRREPLMLVRTVASRQIVTACCRAAYRQGVRIGRNAAEARAVCPNLRHAEHDPQQDDRGLEALARWLMKRFSPVVSVHAPSAIFLDVTGSERLFGGMDRLIESVAIAMTRLGLAHGIAIAPNPSAAWAVACFSGDAPRVVSSEALKRALDPLPIGVLRLDAELLEALHDLGVETIGQLTQLPRHALPSRFGSLLLKRLDQVFGQLADPLLPLAHQVRIGARLEFEGVVDSLDSIWMALKHLIAQVMPELIRRGCGARTLLMQCITPRGEEIQKTISLSRPTCDPVSLFNLLRCAQESMQTEAGFVEMRLSVPVFERVSDEQLHLLNQEQHATQNELADLIQRLRIKLGEDAVLTPRLVECHVPERACEMMKMEHQQSAGTLVMPEERRPVPSRPLRLFTNPTEIRCMVSPSGEHGGTLLSFSYAHAAHAVACLAGPERIAGMWWEGRTKTRDYYDVEDQSGRRFWIFRVVETRKWYLHGLFDC
jgi:protein ImuB